MGILKRFKDIMSANVNALLDKAENPAKMVDQYLRDLESDLGKVKAETAAVMAARVFLQKKSSLEEKRTDLQRNLDIARENANRMRQMHDKLETDIVSLRERKQSIQAKMTLAATQEKMNKLGSSYGKAQGSVSAFDRMEEKANRMLDEANAMADLNRPDDNSAESLMDKYDASSEMTSSAVDAELAEMKRKLGLES